VMTLVRIDISFVILSVTKDLIARSYKTHSGERR
jgi:hypothetical protein